MRRISIIIIIDGEEIKNGAGRRKEEQSKENEKVQVDILWNSMEIN